MSQPLVNPDCRDGKHHACSGQGWDEEADSPCTCPCSCHLETDNGMLAFWSDKPLESDAETVGMYSW